LLDDEKAILEKLEKTSVARNKPCPYESMCHAQKIYLLLGTTKFQDRCITREKLKDVIGENWNWKLPWFESHKFKKLQTAMHRIEKAVKEVTGESTLSPKLKALSAMVKAMNGEAENLVTVEKGTDLKQKLRDIIHFEYELNKEIKRMEKDDLAEVKKDLQNRFDEEGEDIAKNAGMSLNELKCVLGLKRSRWCKDKKKHSLNVKLLQYAKPNSKLHKLKAEKTKMILKKCQGKCKNAKKSFDTFYDILKHQLCLPYTQHTFLQGRSNTIKPRNAARANIIKRIAAFVNRQRRRRRRLLAKDGLTDEDINYEAHWEEFTSMVKSNGKCHHSVLKHVHVESDGTFSFECSKAEELCNCIVKVGKDGVEPNFYAKDGDYKLELNVFRDGGYVSYEILENGEALAYGDVNEGDVEGATGYRRRRRLLGRGRGAS